MNCLPPPARQGLVHVMGNPGMPLQWMNILTWVLLGDIAPTGEVPPLAEAIVNGNLWTRYGWIATFLSLPSPDPNVQSYIASYFHIPYTPVTTTTTTSTTTVAATTTAVSTVTSTTTVTSTVTSTSIATSTAVTTVTVTKPVISTALVIGRVITVTVIAAVAAVIALRRR